MGSWQDILRPKSLLRILAYASNVVKSRNVFFSKKDESCPKWFVEGTNKRGIGVCCHAVLTPTGVVIAMSEKIKLEHIGCKLKRLREALDFSQAELAHRSRVSSTVIAKLESRERDGLSGISLVSLARALNITVEEFTANTPLAIPIPPD